jgi:hypothetical protein
VNYSSTQIRELDRRYRDGIEVALLWDSQTNAILVTVDDSRIERSFVLSVDQAEALDAFRHPYAYITREVMDPAFVT